LSSINLPLTSQKNALPVAAEPYNKMSLRFFIFSSISETVDQEIFFAFGRKDWMLD
jgi:hypothetical protein